MKPHLELASEKVILRVLERVQAALLSAEASQL
jgi:hypothetical protein